MCENNEMGYPPSVEKLSEDDSRILSVVTVWEKKVYRVEAAVKRNKGSVRKKAKYGNISILL